MSEIEWKKRTVEVSGVVLPYELRQRYEEPGIPVGTVIERGEVWVDQSLLYEISERDSDDYLLGNIPTWYVDQRQEAALVMAGWAELETRGSIHGTDKLREILE